MAGPPGEAAGVPPPEDPQATICSCMNVSLAQITHAMKANDLRTAADVARATRASTGCGGCRPELEAVVVRHAEARHEPLVAPVHRD